VTDTNRARVYAQALLQNVTDSLVNQLGAVRQGLRSNPQVMHMLGDPTVEFRDKARRVTELLPAGASQDVQKFVQYLLSENALDDLDQVIAELAHMARGGPRATEAVVTSALPLTEQEQADLRQKLARETGGDLDLTFVVDPELIGGLVVRVGDRVVDASIATRLRQLRESILKAL
jgi:F-type H+-transporting ATPase subunit delta